MSRLFFFCPWIYFPHLVDDHDIVAACQEGVRHPAADEPSRPGDEDGLLSGVRWHLSTGIKGGAFIERERSDK